jgi:hypothetical protein
MVNGGIFPISKEIQASMKRIIGMRIGAIHSRGTLIAGVLKKSCGSPAPRVTPPGGKKGSVT